MSKPLLGRTKVRLPTNFIYPMLNRRALTKDEEKVAFIKSLEEKPKEARKAVIYVHVPYCASYCEFCPFDIVLGDMQFADMKKFSQMVINELLFYSSSPYFSETRVEAVYFGGGTPSMLPLSLISDIVSTILENYLLSSDVQWSFEGEARTLNEKKIEGLKTLGFDRVSFGIQTLDPEIRSLMNLRPTIEQLERCARAIKQEGLALAFDLIYGLPKQTINIFKADVERTVKFHPDIVDVQTLYLPGSGIIRGNKEMMKWLPGLEQILEMERHLFSFYSLHGYHPISNVTWKRLEAEENKLIHGLHRRKKLGDKEVPMDIIPIGPSAYGYIGDYVLQNKFHYRYADKDDENKNKVWWLRKITELEIHKFSIIGFPKRMAVSLSAFDHPLLSHLKENFETWEEWGWIKQNSDSNEYYVTSEGFSRCDRMIWDCFDEKEKQEYKHLYHEYQ